MRLTVEEGTTIQSQGLYLTEKCDGCKTILNQSVTYTIAGKPEVYCSAKCRNRVFFENQLERKKRASPGRCANCGGPLQGKRRGALYCNDMCRKRYAKKNGGISTAGAEISRKSNQSNQQLANPKIAVSTQSLRNQNERSHGALHAKSSLSGAVAELERSLIAERVKAGLRNARAKGKRLGAGPALPWMQPEWPAFAPRALPGARFQGS
ncbi:MAG: recombinase family protein [Deltaproteobacteria bacterium]|nr:recombinase family protein [Deltaproteobacteria bacterium]